MKSTFILSVMLVIIIIGYACTKNDNTENDDSQDFPYENGIFITNEGIFNSGTGSISFFNRNNGETVKDIFEKENNRPLGNIVQSMEAHNNRGYIVVNNASKVEVVQLNTFQSIGVIDNLSSPRYFLGIDKHKGYISDWIPNQVSVVNLNSLSIIKNIPAGTGPEMMLKFINKVFVLNIGGFNVDSTITVIDCHADTVLTIIEVAPKPAGIVQDKNGTLWVLCSGHGWNGYPLPGDTEGHLIAIDPNDYSIITDLPFTETDKHPDKISINNSKDMIYYNHPDGIFSFDITSNSLSNSPLIQHTVPFYSIGIDHTSGNLFASDPLDYSQNGWIYRFNQISGEKIDSFQVGIIPGNFCFN